MRFVFIFTAVVLAGCTTATSANRIAVLQNPETKQTVECRVQVTYGSFSFRDQVENCIRAYEKAGYKVVSDSLNDQ